MQREQIRALDRIAAAATAATDVVVHEGWELRANDRAPFRRTSSVLALGPVTDVDAAIDAAEAFYAPRGVPTRFQVSPASMPDDLDAVLAARGYEVEAPVNVATAPAIEVVERSAGDRAATIGSLDAGWVAQYAAVHSDDERERTRVQAYGEMLHGLPLASAGALVGGGAGERAVALGFAVADGEWAGIFGMGTRPEARRTGGATAVLHALATWAMDQSATRLYLQVEVDNPGARALYARAGFGDAYGYHYRTRHDGAS
jgi:GNAT superfamily N-acetyltransferase